MPEHPFVFSKENWLVRLLLSILSHGNWIFDSRLLNQNFENPICFGGNMPLPKPEGRQKEVVYLPAKGHFAVLGTAGSGKTTMAILRALFLSDPNTDHCGNTLLVTFNVTLVTYLKSLLVGIPNDIIVENYHKVARGYLNSRGKMRYGAIASNDLRETILNQVICDKRAEHGNLPLLNRSADFFVEEVKWISQHGLRTLQDYVAAERQGRGHFRMTRAQRPLMFEVYEEYVSRRRDHGKDYDWDDLSCSVSDELDNDDSPRLYKHIVIDEGQDLSPEMIRSLVKMVPNDGTITFFGDVAQQIYGNRMSWRSAGLEIAKVWEFEENYRNSKQIARLALEVSRMPFFEGVPDIVEPKTPAADGPLPTLVRCSDFNRAAKLATDQGARLAQTQSVAILYRTRSDERVLEPLLPAGSTRLRRDMNEWIDGPGIRYGTFHSSKGLEFDTVIMPFCTLEDLPNSESVSLFGEEEAMAIDGRLFYVGVTRAKRVLLAIYYDELTPLMPENKGLYGVFDDE